MKIFRDKSDALDLRRPINCSAQPFTDFVLIIFSDLKKEKFVVFDYSKTD